MVKGFGGRALVVTGLDVERAEPFIGMLREHGVETIVYPVVGEPEIKAVEQGVRAANKCLCDMVISFGGGSAIDAGKAIAAMLANEGELFDYLEVVGRGQALVQPSAPFVAIPTTAGTGSEVTRNAVLASPVHKVKVSLRSPFMLARIAVVDPELTHDLPPTITASTGLDALTQLIEPYVCARTNPMTDGLCVEGIRRAARSLRIAVEDGKNVVAREDMAVASLFGGLALANAGLGAVHGFAGPIGGRFAAPHGAVCAILLPQVMAMNLRALRQRQPGADALRRYEEVGRLLTDSPAAGAEEGVAWVTKLVADLKIPPLRTYGITREHLAELVANSAKASSMKANPIVLTEAELGEILEAAM